MGRKMGEVKERVGAGEGEGTLVGMQIEKNVNKQKEFRKKVPARKWCYPL